MTYDEKVRWLRRYQDSLRREKELAEEVERLRSEAARQMDASCIPPAADLRGMQKEEDRRSQIHDEIPASGGRRPAGSPFTAEKPALQEHRAMCPRIQCPGHQLRPVCGPRAGSGGLR